MPQVGGLLFPHLVGLNQAILGSMAQQGTTSGTKSLELTGLDRDLTVQVKPALKGELQGLYGPMQKRGPNFGHAWNVLYVFVFVFVLSVLFMFFTYPNSTNSAQEVPERAIWREQDDIPHNQTGRQKAYSLTRTVNDYNQTLRDQKIKEYQWSLK